MRVTQDTIAKNVGVDRTTVSICLGNLKHRIDKIRPEVRARILAEAKRLNYRPNFFATQLRRGQSKIILACVMKLQDYHASVILEAFAQRVSLHGYRVIVSCFADAENPEDLIGDIVGPQGVSAIALISRASDCLPESSLGTYLDEKVKVVLLGRQHEDPRIGQVFVDEEKAASLAIRHLVDQQMGKIWIVAYEKSFWKYQEERIESIQSQLRALNLPQATVVRVPDLDNDQVADKVANVVTDALENASELPASLLCVTDILAWGSVRALRNKEYAQVGVMGYDDLFPSRSLIPALTSIHQPAREMGQIGGDLLLKMMNTPKFLAKPQKLDPKLMIRESTMGNLVGG